MNKTELVDKVADKASVKKSQAQAVVDAMIETIMETVASGDKVTLVGFGSFEPRDRKKREGRNPKNWRENDDSSHYGSSVLCR